MVFYRTYRPQTIEELDSEEVRNKLSAVLAKAAPTFLQIPHAFLFTGPKGLGKTSTARIVAKIINCIGRKDKNGKNIEPCNTCEQCSSITNGTNMDVLEIDAASNRGIDEMRDLKDKIRLAPMSSKKKVYIIDEVHMLTTEAFNALLKTLEEPPTHAVFILCTTEMHKVPPTILSRCFHINFRLATPAELVRSFERILKGEGIKADKKTLLIIAEFSEGGFRDGAKVIEELATLSENKTITLELLETKFHFQSMTKLITDLFTALEKRDLQTSLSYINQVIKEGLDSKSFISLLINKVHDVFLVKVSEDKERNGESALSLSELTYLLNLLTKALQETKSAVIAQLPLEIAVITWCQQAETSKDEKGEAFVSEKKATNEVSVNSLRKQAGNISKVKAAYGNGEKNDKKDSPGENEKAAASILSYSVSGDHSEEWLQALWKNIVISIKPHNHMIAGVLRSCRIKSFDRKVLIIEALSPFHLERLTESKTHKLLLQICEELIGNPVQVTVELKA